MLKKIGLGLLVFVFASALMIGGCRGLEMPEVLQDVGWEWKLSEWLESNSSFGAGIGTSGEGSLVSVESDGIKIGENPGNDWTGIDLTLLTLDVFPLQFSYEIEVAISGAAASSPSVQKMPGWQRFTEIPDGEIGATTKTLGPAEFGDFAGTEIRIVNGNGTGPAFTITEIVIRNTGSKEPVTGPGPKPADWPNANNFDTAYVVPTEGASDTVFFLDLADIADTVTDSIAGGALAIAVSEADKVTYYFDENKNEARLAIALPAALKTALETADSVDIAIVGEAQKDEFTEFRYHLGDPTAGANWNATGAGGPGKFSEILTKNLGIDNADRATHLIFQIRNVNWAVLEITSIKITVNAEPLPDELVFDNPMDLFVSENLEADAAKAKWVEIDDEEYIFVSRLDAGTLADMTPSELDGFEVETLGRVTLHFGIAAYSGWTNYEKVAVSYKLIPVEVDGEPETAVALIRWVKGPTRGQGSNSGDVGGAGAKDLAAASEEDGIYTLEFDLTEMPAGDDALNFIGNAAGESFLIRFTEVKFLDLK